MTRPANLIIAKESITPLEYSEARDDHLAAIDEAWSGSVAPAHAIGRRWLDTTATPWVLKVSDGTQWIDMGEIVGNEYQSSIPGYTFLKATQFSSSGTWTPDADTRLAVLKVQAPGGGGGGCSGSGSGVGASAGGGGGGYIERWLTAGWGATETITIGAVGAGGTGDGTGGTGGQTSVGTLAVANGGSGGGGATRTTATQRGAGSGGLGGTVSSTGGTSIKTLEMQGGYGTIGALYGSLATTGVGGDSFLGQGGLMRTEGQAGIGGRFYGGGGGGASANSATSVDGGDGGEAIVTILEHR